MTLAASVGAVTPVVVRGKKRFEIINGVECDPDLVFSMYFTQAVSTLTKIEAKGGQTITLLNATASATYKIKSSSDNDKAGGSGLRTVRVFSYSTSNVLQYEDIDPNGTTGATLTSSDVSSFLFMVGLTTGSGGLAAGNITITNSAGTTYYLAINANTFAGFCTDIHFKGGWYGIAEICAASVITTTATDTFALTLYERLYTGSGKNPVSYAAPMSPGAALRGTDTVCLLKTMNTGMSYTLYGLKLGTTDQTVQGIIKIGLVN